MNGGNTLSSFLSGEKKGGKCCALIAAAGVGSRMNCEGSKVLLPIGNKPVLVLTLEAFQACRSIDSVVVVTRHEDIFYIAELCKKYNLQKVNTVVAGGKTRTDSVKEGLSHIDESFKYVAVHDGARPFITPKCIDDVVLAAKEYGAAAAGVHVLDTVKKCDAQIFILETVDRRDLWFVQTPQVFERGLLISAYDNTEKNNIEITDDCMAVESLNIKIKMVECGYENIKITTPFDLITAQKIIKLRGEST